MDARKYYMRIIGNVEYREYISREDLKKEPDKIFLFGDNLLGKGLAGQAAEMRGEHNAIGIPTKKLPSNTDKSFFNDAEFDENKKQIDKAFARIPKGKVVVVPSRGLGTGLAQLNIKAPKTFYYLNECIHNLEYPRG